MNRARLCICATYPPQCKRRCTLMQNILNQKLPFCRCKYARQDYRAANKRRNVARKAPMRWSGACCVNSCVKAVLQSKCKRKRIIVTVIIVAVEWVLHNRLINNGIKITSQLDYGDQSKYTFAFRWGRHWLSTATVNRCHGINVNKRRSDCAWLLRSHPS